MIIIVEVIYYVLGSVFFWEKKAQKPCVFLYVFVHL